MNFCVFDTRSIVANSISIILRSIVPESRIRYVRDISDLRSCVGMYGEFDLVVYELFFGESIGSKIRALKEINPSGRVVILSENDSSHLRDACILLGGDVFWTKKSSIHMLRSEIVRVISDFSSVNNVKFLPIKLSHRQSQIVFLIDLGFSNDEISRRLSISCHTVKVHVYRIFNKFGVSSRLELIKLMRDMEMI